MYQSRRNRSGRGICFRRVVYQVFTCSWPIYPIHSITVAGSRIYSNPILSSTRRTRVNSISLPTVMSSNSATKRAKPLTSRPLDLFYTVFFALHIPTFLVIDSQSLFLDGPRPTAKIIEFYLSEHNDPLIGGAFGEWPVFGWTAVWFRSYLWLEALYLFPMFVLGIVILIKGEFRQSERREEGKLIFYNR